MVHGSFFLNNKFERIVVCSYRSEMCSRRCLWLVAEAERGRENLWISFYLIFVLYFFAFFFFWYCIYLFIAIIWSDLKVRPNFVCILFDPYNMGLGSYSSFRLNLLLLAYKFSGFFSSLYKHGTILSFLPGNPARQVLGINGLRNSC